MERQTAILVLGMHRSGTSVLTAALAGMGVDLGDELIPADQHNQKGYWESREINRALEEILQSAGSRWHDWRRLVWLDEGARARAKATLVGVVERKFRGAPLFAIKDPRSCRLAGVWREVFSELGVEQKVVIPVRHPLEVASSLNSRDGMPRDKALLLWTRHVLDAILAARSVAATIVQYDKILSDAHAETKRISSALGVTWPYDPDKSGPAIDQIVDANLRHYSIASVENAVLERTPCALNLWRLLREEDSIIRDTAAIDAIEEDFERALAPFENYFGKMEESYEKALANIGTLRRELDRAKWSLGAQVLEGAVDGDDPRQALRELRARVEILESVLVDANRNLR